MCVLRVIGGSARSCPLIAPKGFSTRPTADSVRESLFNILQGEVAGKRVLDLFAGTGAFGVEALSRNAAFSCFVDSDAECADVIAKNLAKTKLGEKARIVRADVFDALVRLRGERFGLIFADPPYGQTDGFFREILSALDENALIDEGGVIMFERKKNEPNVEAAGFEIKRVKEYSNAKIIFIGKLGRR